jgi:hypothetical protein
MAFPSDSARTLWVVPAGTIATIPGPATCVAPPMVTSSTCQTTSWSWECVRIVEPVASSQRVKAMLGEWKRRPCQPGRFSIAGSCLVLTRASRFRRTDSSAIAPPRSSALASGDSSAPKKNGLPERELRKAMDPAARGGVSQAARAAGAAGESGRPSIQVSEPIINSVVA